jgi:hypothetical protein
VFKPLWQNWQGRGKGDFICAISLPNSICSSQVTKLESTVTPIEILTPVILVLAFVGYAFCLSRLLWVTLGVTAALGFYFSRAYPLEGGNLFYWGVGGAVVFTAWLAAMVLRRAEPESMRAQTSKKPVRKPTRNRKSKQKLPGVVIDGTNVMYWDGQADLRTLQIVVDKLVGKNLAPHVFLDASSRHHLGDKSLDQISFAAALGLHRNQVTVCPAQTEADAFLLKFAKDNSMPVVSNDRFGDRAALAKGLKLVKGVIAGGKPVLQGL